MKKFFLVVLLLASIVFSSKAQDYENAIGLRLGISNGITFKHRLAERNMFEFIFASRFRGMSLTGLYERQLISDLFGFENFNAFAGFGGHLGRYDGVETTWANKTGKYTVIGVDGIIGLEYNFSKFPINVSVDWKPYAEIIGFSFLYPEDLTFSIRYMLN